MKISVFGHKHVPSREGGIEVVVGQLCSRMAALGHAITCYNRTGIHAGGQKPPVGTDMPAGVRCRSVLTVNKKGLAAVTSSISAAICTLFDGSEVVHIHAEGPAMMTWLPKLFGKRVVVTVHGLDWQREKWKSGFGARYIRAGERMAVKYADEIIVLSRNVQEYFKKEYNRNTVWIPNGVCLPETLPAKEIRKKYSLEKDGYILFLGRLVPEKGVHYLIEAYRQLDTDKKLVIAGGMSDTADYVQSLLQQGKDDGRIIFTDFVQGSLLQELYSNAWIYVLPSDLEGMPLSLLEAMSYGNCCLVSDIAECTEVVGENAVVFRRGDVDDLRQKLQQLCCDSETVARLKAEAPRYICQKYNWDEITQKTLGLYVTAD